MKFAFISSQIGFDWEHLMASYKKYVKSNHIVVEIGPALPSKTKDLKKFCNKLIGVELLSPRIPKFKDTENIEYLVGDWQELSQIIKPNSIDILISSHVIEHCQNDTKTINETYRVLKPGGVAIILTPNRERLVRVFIELFKGKRKFPFWEHVREYTEKDLMTLLLASHFKNNFIIEPVAIGLLSSIITLYSKKVPSPLRRFSSYWEIHLFKR
jgi:SAM-dependent methyltransferase